MLKIRLQRTGRRNDPSFRIIVVEHSAAAKAGTFVERVGTYNPRTKERKLAADRIMYWLSKGAQASATMHNMLISAGVIKGKKINVLPKKTVMATASSEANIPPAPAAPEEEVREVEQESKAEETLVENDVAAESSSQS